MISTGLMNTAAELAVAIMPIIAVFHLRVAPQQRWGVVGLFSLGFITGIAGCMRSYFVFRLHATYDISWWSTPIWICAEVELCSALVCYIC